jgi:hypothetical protein
MNLIAIEHELGRLLKQGDSGPRYARVMRMLRKACHAHERVFVKEGKRWKWLSHIGQPGMR